jgi:hypothetical protein
MDERLELLLHPSISPDALEAISEIASRLKQGEISEEDAIEQAEQIAPGSSKLFNFSEWSDQAKATLLAGVIAATGAIAAAKIASGTSSVTNVTINNYPSYHNEEVIEPAGERKRLELAPTSSPMPVLRPGRFKNSTSLAPVSSLLPKTRPEL